MTTDPFPFPSIEELAIFAAQLETADRSGCIRRLGNWSPAQAAWHVADFIRASIDGFGFRAPLALRVLARPLRFMLFSRRPIPRGISLRGPMEVFVPRADISPTEGFGHLHAQLSRIRSGETCQQPSPIFGRLSHEEWMAVHLKHAAHHFALFEMVDENSAKIG